MTEIIKRRTRMIHRVRTTLSFIAVFYKLHPSSAMFMCLSLQVSVKLSDRCSLGTNKNGRQLFPMTNSKVIFGVLALTLFLLVAGLVRSFFQFPEDKVKYNLLYVRVEESNEN